MERESFLSGYCRQIDASRMVTVVAEGAELAEVDCLFDSCTYAPNCTVAQRIREFLEEG